MFQEIMGNFNTGKDFAICVSECTVYCENSCVSCSSLELVKAELRLSERTDNLLVIRLEA